MSTVEIIDVRAPADVSAALLGCFVDSPVVGEGQDGFVLHADGWVLGRSSPARAVEVSLEGRLLRTVPVRGARADLEEAFPEVPPRTDAAFHALVGVPGLPPEFELTLEALLEDGSRHRVGAIRARHEPLRTDFTPKLQPFVVTCLGRTGTTLLMRTLAGHPDVVMFDRYPYEFEPARYWLHALKVLSEPANIVESSHPSTFHDDPWHVGNNPFYDDGVARNERLHDLLGRTQVEALAAFCQRSIDDWYVAVAEDQRRPGARRFAEKQMWPTQTQWLLWELYPDAREVFLVRDFRDMVCSILAFDEKRGFAGFLRADHKSDEDYVREDLAALVGEFHRAWKAREGRAHLVRYEDLVLDPQATLRALLEYVGVDASAGMVAELSKRGAAEDDELVAHRTSPGPRASIGRWRRERDEGFSKLCEEAFGDALDEFGYTAEAVAG